MENVGAMHLIFECNALQDLCVSFAPLEGLFQRATTMQQFMWQPDLVLIFWEQV